MYMGAKQELLNKLQVQQNRALKNCLKVDKLHPTQDIHARTKVKYVTKPKFKVRANEALLLIQTRSRIKVYERRVLEIAVKAWNSQTVQERNIPDMVKYKRCVLRQ